MFVDDEDPRKARTMTNGGHPVNSVTNSPVATNGNGHADAVITPLRPVGSRPSRLVVRARGAGPGSLPTVTGTAPVLDVPAEVVEGCRSASLHMGGPSLRRLGVTSCIRGEGRSTVAIATAMLHSQDYGRRVVLLELDLFNPHLGRRLGLSAGPGLAEWLCGEARLDQVVQRLSSTFAVITAGDVGEDGPTLLHEMVASDRVREIEQCSDIVVAALPPLLGSSAGLQAAMLFSSILLVVRAGVTGVPLVQRCVHMLPDPPVVLLNGTASRLPRWLRRIAGDPQ